MKIKYEIAMKPGNLQYIPLKHLKHDILSGENKFNTTPPPKICNLKENCFYVLSALG